MPPPFSSITPNAKSAGLLAIFLHCRFLLILSLALLVLHQSITLYYIFSSNMSSKKSNPDEVQLSFNEIMAKASKNAIRGGTAGAVAMGANVAALMWMRTTVSMMKE